MKVITKESALNAFSFFISLTVALCFLRVSGIIDWHYGIIFAPLYIPVVILCSVSIIFMALFKLANWGKKRRESKTTRTEL